MKLSANVVFRITSFLTDAPYIEFLWDSEFFMGKRSRNHSGSAGGEVYLCLEFWNM